MLIGAVACLAAGAQAQNYPDRPVKIVVGSAPGGGLDVFVRGVAQELSSKWGTPVIVDNKPGASGIISAEAAANAPADGYTLFGVTDQIFLANRFAFKKLPYDPDNTFSSIILMAQADQFLYATDNVPARDLKELVALDKAKPGSLAYGSWGDGSPPHLVFETLNKAAGTKFLNVPYKGGAPLSTAIAANEVQLTVFSAGMASPLVKSGKLKPLAIAAAARDPQFPDVPSVDEAGYRQLRAFIWFGLAARAGTPREIIDRVNADVRVILTKPAFSSRFVAPGWRVVSSTPAGMDATLKEQLPIVQEMSRNASVTPQ